MAADACGRNDIRTVPVPCARQRFSVCASGFAACQFSLFQRPWRSVDAVSRCRGCRYSGDCLIYRNFHFAFQHRIGITVLWCKYPDCKCSSRVWRVRILLPCKCACHCFSIITNKFRFMKQQLWQRLPVGENIVFQCHFCSLFQAYGDFVGQFYIYCDCNVRIILCCHGDGYAALIVDVPDLLCVA